MFATSSLQTLPTNVIYDTVFLMLQRSSRLYSHTEDLSNFEVKQLLKLSHICRSWREISLSILCHTHTVSPTTQTLQIPSIFADKAYFGYTRRFEVHIDDQNITDGNSLLSKYLYFPHANNVKVHIRGTCTTVIEEECHDYINAQKLAKRIEAVAPNAHNVHIIHNEYPVSREKGYWAAVDAFTDSLYGESQTHSLSIDTHYRISQNSISEGRALTSLSFAWDECSSDAFKLLDIHSATLQVLSIHGVGEHDISRLLINSNGCPITYPYLLELTLNSQSGTELASSDQNNMVPAGRPSFKNMVPFPRLVKLNANIVYPFGDDVLFRGNSSTLEELSFNFDSKAIAMVRSARVFVPGKYKRLSTVKVGSFIEDIDFNDTQVKQHISLIKNIAPAVKSLHICDIDISQYFISKLSDYKQFTSIHTLNLCELHLDILDVITILKALPALQHLESGLVKSLAVASKPDFGNLNKVCTKYSEISRYFSQWTVSKDSIICTASSALYAVVLASICPRFRSVQLPGRYRSKYFEMVKQLTENSDLLKLSGIQNRLLSANPNEYRI